MPFYDFRCPTCEEQFEVQRPMAERDEPTTCPQGHEGAKRVITSVGVTGGIRYGSPATAARKGTLAGSVKPAESTVPKTTEPEGTS